MRKEKKLLFKVAGIGFAVNWTYPPLWKHWDFCYDDFLSFNRRPAAGQLKHLAKIKVRWVDKNGELPRGEKSAALMAMPGFWTLYGKGDGYILENFNVRLNRLMSVAEINSDFTAADYYPRECLVESPRLYNRKRRKFWMLPRLLVPLARFMLINILAGSGGCLAHGAAVKIGHQGLAFIGPSGSGKTTLAKFFRRSRGKGITVLTDEGPILARAGNDFYLHGTPWPGGGRIASACSAPLKKIFFISHGRENIIKPVSRAEAVRKLMAQTVFCAWNNFLVSAIMDFVKDLSREVEFFDLEFVKDKSIVPFVIENLRRSGEKRR